MIRSVSLNHTGPLRSDLSHDEFPAVIKDPKSILWVDFQNESNSSAEPILRTVFNFHPLAIDDALTENHVPKIDDWTDYVYVVLHAVEYDHQHDTLETVELDVFLGKNYIVTHHDAPIKALERVWSNIGRDERFYRMGCDHILYRLTDELVVDYMQTIEDLDDQIEIVEDEMFSEPSPLLLNRTFALKRASLRLRRILSPLREVLNKLARDEYEVIDQKDRIYFRDVYDHLVRLHDIAESIRDLVGSAQDTYLSVINNRMNDIMKTLTVITTLFMPISFISGFFGMNFFSPSANLESWTGIVMFSITLIVMIVTPFTMLLWMRRRGWM